MFLEQNTWVSLKQDARGNLVVKTLIFVSGHETRSTAIPKLGKTQISMSGHETRSKRWIFPFLPFAEGICCERPLDVIIIPTNGHTTVCFFPKNCTFFFSGRNCEPPKHPSSWNPPKHSHWWPDDWAYFFPNVTMHYICKVLLTNFLAQVHCTCTPMFLEQNEWVSLKQDARGNLVAKTPIFVSGHETRSTAIPKLGKTWISVSGHETRSNHWIFPFPPFAESVCCERPLGVIIIPTDGHTTVCFF